MRPSGFNSERPSSSSSAKGVLHLVVGAGIPIYVWNAIDSILQLTSDDVLVVYNFLSDTDRREMQRVLGLYARSRRLESILNPNFRDSQQKTGSLYTSYNIALDRAVGRYRFLNIVQSDMQMVFWEPGIADEIEETITRARELGLGNVLCVETAMHVRGKTNPDRLNEAYSTDIERAVCVNREQAYADVGVFDLTEVERLSFRFEGTESRISRRLLSLGYVMPRLSRQPLAFLPWPAVVRGNRVVGRRFLSRYQGIPLLQVDKTLQEQWKKGVLSSYPSYWMEDFVQPRGWSCLWPYWPTDILSNKWIRRRVETTKSLRIGFFASVPVGLAPRRFVPNPFHFVWAWFRQMPTYALKLHSFTLAICLVVRRELTHQWRFWKR